MFHSFVVERHDHPLSRLVHHRRAVRSEFFKHVRTGKPQAFYVETAKKYASRPVKESHEIRVASLRFWHKFKAAVKEVYKDPHQVRALILWGMTGADPAWHQVAQGIWGGFATTGVHDYPGAGSDRHPTEVAEGLDSMVTPAEVIAQQPEVLQTIERLARSMARGDKETIEKLTLEEVKEGWLTEVDSLEPNMVYLRRFLGTQERWDREDGDFKKQRALNNGRMAGINRCNFLPKKPWLQSVDNFLGLAQTIISKAVETFGGNVGIVTIKWDECHAFRNLLALNDVLQRVVVIPRTRHSFDATRTGPFRNLRFFTCARLLFGEVASVASYCAVAALCSFAIALQLGVAAPSYFDDWCACLLTSDASARQHIFEFLELIDLPVQVAKCAFGVVNLYLGIEVEVSAKAIRVSLSRMRRSRLIAVIEGILKRDEGRGWLPPGEAAELCGRLGFGSAYCLDACGRVFLGPLYSRAADKRVTNTNWNLNDAMIEAMRWWVRVLRSDAFGDRWVPVDRDDVDGSDFVIASSDASGDYGIGGTLEDVKTGEKWYFSESYSQTPKQVARLDDGSVDIVDGESMATTRTQEVFWDKLRRRKVLFFCDNGVLTPRLTNVKCPYARQFWLNSALLHAFTWLEFVRSGCNTGDGPSRGAFALLEAIGFRRVLTAGNTA